MNFFTSLESWHTGINSFCFGRRKSQAGKGRTEEAGLELCRLALKEPLPLSCWHLEKPREGIGGDSKLEEASAEEKS
jgi:hypothetical protein